MAPILVWYILFFLSYRSDKWQVNSIDLPWKKFAYNVIFYLLYKQVRKKYNTQNNESKAQTKSEGNGQRKEMYTNNAHIYTISNIAGNCLYSMFTVLIKNLFSHRHIELFLSPCYFRYQFKWARIFLFFFLFFVSVLFT